MTIKIKTPEETEADSKEEESVKEEVSESNPSTDSEENVETKRDNHT